MIITNGNRDILGRETLVNGLGPSLSIPITARNICRRRALSDNHIREATQPALGYLPTNMVQNFRRQDTAH